MLVAMPHPGAVTFISMIVTRLRGNVLPPPFCFTLPLYLYRWITLLAGTFVASGYYASSGSPTRCPHDTYASAPRLLTDASGCSPCTEGFTTNLTDGNVQCGERGQPKR
jgi:hypothetical protein